MKSPSTRAPVVRPQGIAFRGVGGEEERVVRDASMEPAYRNRIGRLRRTVGELETGETETGGPPWGQRLAELGALSGEDVR
jgi:hypothetical protein